MGTCTAAAGIRSFERICWTILQGFAPGLHVRVRKPWAHMYCYSPIHFVDEGYPGNVVPSHLPVHRRSLALDACDRAEYENGTVQHAQGALHLNGEVNVSFGALRKVQWLTHRRYAPGVSMILMAYFVFVPLPKSVASQSQNVAAL